MMESKGTTMASLYDIVQELQKDNTLTIIGVYRGRRQEFKLHKNRIDLRARSLGKKHFETIVIMEHNKHDMVEVCKDSSSTDNHSKIIHDISIHPPYQKSIILSPELANDIASAFHAFFSDGDTELKLKKYKNAAFFMNTIMQNNL